MVVIVVMAMTVMMAVVMIVIVRIVVVVHVGALWSIVQPSLTLTPSRNNHRCGAAR